MSESVKAAQTLVWRGGGGYADKTHRICDSTGGRNSTLLGEKEVSCCGRSLGYEGRAIYTKALIALARYRR